jgi:enoyl-CoA hydratase/carnithine racemase
MSSGQVHLSIDGGVASILIDRPEARNAMTWAMYDQLAEICERVAADRDVRVATIRGAGGQAFVAGTDIEQFSAFQSGEDGIAYEKVIDMRVGQVERLPVPTIAIVDGWAIGGGLAISAACDFRLASPQASFGVPIARTLGNCLSMANLTRVVAAFGVPRAKKMLLLGETIGADEALACGFVTAIATPGELEAKAAELCKRLLNNAPVTMRVSKEGIRRVVNDSHPLGEDLIRECYGSRDFKIGVNAFLEKKRPAWTGA